MVKKVKVKAIGKNKAKAIDKNKAKVKAIGKNKVILKSMCGERRERGGRCKIK